MLRGIITIQEMVKGPGIADCRSNKLDCRAAYGYSVQSFLLVKCVDIWSQSSLDLSPFLSELPLGLDSRRTSLGQSRK